MLADPLGGLLDRFRTRVAKEHGIEQQTTAIEVNDLNVVQLGQRQAVERGGLEERTY
ncbi:MAG: hypothetical protein ABI047_15600 [Jatrophihabitantaceae bacterium]